MRKCWPTLVELGWPSINIEKSRTWIVGKFAGWSECECCLSVEAFKGRVAEALADSEDSSVHRFGIEEYVPIAM